MKESLKKALFYNDFERVQMLMESPHFCQEWLFDCGDFKGVPTPIYYITLLWNEMWSGSWVLCQDAVDSHKEGLRKIVSYIEQKFNVSASGVIDLEKYVEFFREDTNYWEDEDFRNAGFRDIDMELYRATSRYDYAEVERLLRLGAKDDIRLEKCDPESSTYGNMSDDFLEREWWQIPTLYPNTNYEAREFEQMMVLALFESIAKERMVKLLDRYTK
jgi:hypothetical protein